VKNLTDRKGKECLEAVEEIAFPDTKYIISKIILSRYTAARSSKVPSCNFEESL
jgi:hypothetical protein